MDYIVPFLNMRIYANGMNEGTRDSYWSPTMKVPRQKRTSYQRNTLIDIFTSIVMEEFVCEYRMSHKFHQRIWTFYSEAFKTGEYVYNPYITLLLETYSNFWRTVQNLYIYMWYKFKQNQHLSSLSQRRWRLSLISNFLVYWLGLFVVVLYLFFFCSWTSFVTYLI